MRGATLHRLVHACLSRSATLQGSLGSLPCLWAGRRSWARLSVNVRSCLGCWLVLVHVTGLWDVVNTEEVPAIVRQGSLPDVHTVAQRLVTEASLRGASDNVTVLCIDFRCVCGVVVPSACELWAAVFTCTRRLPVSHVPCPVSHCSVQTVWPSSPAVTTTSWPSQVFRSPAPAIHSPGIQNVKPHVALQLAPRTSSPGSVATTPQHEQQQQQQVQPPEQQQQQQQQEHSPPILPPHDRPSQAEPTVPGSSTNHGPVGL